MIVWFSHYVKGLSPMFIDGLIYVLLALFASIATSLSSDEAVKFINPVVLFYAKTFFTATSAGLLALKLFRSTSYADHKAAAEKRDEIQQQTKVT